jgi:uncharacterized oxidoreductase
VIISGRRKDALEAATRANPGMKSAVVDLANTSGIPAFAAQVAEQYPSLNVLINNAGIMKPENVLDASGVAEATITTNLLAPISLTSALLPHLKKQDHAAVMTVSSGLAFVPLAMTPTYCATKAAIHSYTQSLRYQLQGSNVQVLELVPPYVQTELMGSEQAEDARAMPLGEFIAEVMDILKNQQSMHEICVKRVFPLRTAAEKGQAAFEEFFQSFNKGMSSAASGH